MSEIKIQIEEKQNLSEKISIIGTSEFGISIGKRLLHFGFDVIYGSCDPNLEYLKKCFEEKFTMNRLSVTTILEALHQADSIVFLAVSFDFYENLAGQIVESLSKKHKTKNSTILIDASNLHDLSHGKTLRFSNAEKLESLVQKQIVDSKLDHQVNVIKAFNLLNSNSMSQYIENITKSIPITVPIAGNDTLSKQKVKDLCTKLGFSSYDIGSLESALKLELANKLTSEQWKQPTLICLFYFLINFLWMLLSDYLFSKEEENNFKLSLMSLITKSSGFTALYLLSFIYFGPVVASIYQIKNGVGYRKIPKWLERFLKMRKKFTLWGFIFATVHVMLSMVILNDNYFGSWFKKSDEKFRKMALNGELSTISGVIAYLLFVLVALANCINSIEYSLNRSECNLVNRKIGLSCLLIGVLHNFSMIYGHLDLIKELTLKILVTKTKFVAILFPFIVFVLRILLNYGPLKRKIEKVKNGEVINKKMKYDKINI